MLSAIYKREPYCPKCFQALPAPEWWGRTDNKEQVRAEAVQTFCEHCKLPIFAQFFVGRDF